MSRTTNSERRAALLEQRKVIDEQLRKIDVREREQGRKDDTRRKVIAGALALDDMQKNPDSPLAARLRELLQEFVDARSRHLFPFLPTIDMRENVKHAASDVLVPTPKPVRPEMPLTETGMPDGTGPARPPPTSGYGAPTAG